MLKYIIRETRIFTVKESKQKHCTHFKRTYCFLNCAKGKWVVLSRNIIERIPTSSGGQKFNSPPLRSVFSAYVPKFRTFSGQSFYIRTEKPRVSVLSL